MQLLGANFTFRYFPSDEEIYDVEEASSDFFISLFDADSELLTAFNLCPCFVREYHEHGSPTGPEKLATTSEQNILKSLPKDPTILIWDEMQWGPSTPFEPYIAGQWAEQWITRISEADDDFLTVAFPCTLDIRTGKSNLHRQCAIEDLQRLTAQAECAQQQGAYLTVEAIWS